jgi:hypothetical protein
MSVADSITGANKLGYAACLIVKRLFYQTPARENHRLDSKRPSKTFESVSRMISAATVRSGARQRFPAFPKELQNSPIHILWQKYIVLPMGDFEPTRPDRIKRSKTSEKSDKRPQLVDDLDPVDRDRIKNAFRIFDEAKKSRA